MKKLLICLLIAIPIAIIFIVNFTVEKTYDYMNIPVDEIVISEDVVSSININETYNLSASLYPLNASNKKVVWRSDNENIAQVDENGKVSFLGCGEVHIFATTLDGGISKSCFFYVTDTKVHELQFTTSEEILSIGEGVQTAIAVLPVEAENRTVVYKSYDENVVKISQNGYVEAVGLGYATVSATTEDGGYTKYLTFRVITPLENVVIENENVCLSNNTYQIEYAKSPSNADILSEQYICSDETIASVSQKGKITFHKPGKCSVVIIINETVTKKINFEYVGQYISDILINIPVENTAYLSTGSMFINYDSVPHDANLQNVSITSSDENVLCIESGYAVFKSAGQANITISGKTSNGSLIEKTIYFTIVPDAKELALNDVYYTGQKTYAIDASVKPFDMLATYSYRLLSSSDLAQIDSNGNIEILTDDSVEVCVEVKATSNGTTFTKLCRVIYTNSKPCEMEIESTFNAQIDEVITLSPKFYPESTNSFLSIEFIDADGKVTCTENNKIIFTEGGTFVALVSYENYLGNAISKQITFNVYCPVGEITPNLDLDYLNDIYYTSKTSVALQCNVLPLYATNRDVCYTIQSGDAVIENNVLTFTSVGLVSVLAYIPNENIEAIFSIMYTGPLATSVTLSDMPTELEVGESFELSILNYFPKDAFSSELVITTTKNTSQSGLPVVQIENQKVTAVCPGACVLTLTAGNYVKNVQLHISQPAKSIFLLSNIIYTDKEFVDLTSLFEIQPQNHTTGNVTFSIVQGEGSIINSVLTFTREGDVRVKLCLDGVEGSEKYITFTYVPNDPTTQNAKIYLPLGDEINLNVSTYFNGEYDSYSITSQQDIIAIAGTAITGVSVGNATIKIEYKLNDTAIFTTEKEVQCIKACQELVVNDDLYYEGIYYTSKPSFQLDVRPLPEDLTFANYSIEILQYIPETPSANSQASVEGNSVLFNSFGTAYVKIQSEDGFASKILIVKYCQDIITAKLNHDNITMTKGESVVIEIDECIPNDIVINTLSISNTLGNDIVVDIRGNSIFALKPGFAKIEVLVNGTYKCFINVTVNEQVSDIVADSDIVTSNANFQIQYQIFPETATNKELIFEIISSSSDKTTISQNGVLQFKEPSTCTVKITSVASPDVTALVNVESTYNLPISAELSATKILEIGQSFKVVFGNVQPADLIDFDYEITSNNNNIANIITSQGMNYVVANGSGETDIIVKYTNNKSELVTLVCHIVVPVHVENISLNYDNFLTYYGSIYTAESDLQISPSFFPENATNLDYDVVISNDIATYDKSRGTLSFTKEGSVSITFVAKDKTNGNVSSTVNIKYTTQIVSATLAQDNPDLSNIEINYGENLKMYYQVVPRNLQVVASLGNQSNPQTTKITNQSDQTGLSFTITAIETGINNFTIKLNGNISLCTMTVKIKRELQSIYFNQETIYLSNNQITLNALPYPSNATDYQIAYETTSNKVEITGNKITFNAFGEAIITAYCVGNESIKCKIKLIHSNDVEKISFDASLPKTIFIREALYLDVKMLPERPGGINVNYKIERIRAFSKEQGQNVDIDKANFSEYVEINEYDVLLSKNLACEIVISASVDGREDIEKCYKTIKIAKAITSLTLNVDSSGDMLGLARERVFGNFFYDVDKNKTGLSRGMQIEVISSNVEVERGDIIYSSSNPEIAYIDVDGMLMFNDNYYNYKRHKYINVTITAQPKVQYNQANPCIKEYTFNLVYGVNIFNQESFPGNKSASFQEPFHVYPYSESEEPSETLNVARLGIVLHCNVNLNPDDDPNVVFGPEDIFYCDAVYGNGHMIYSTYDKDDTTPKQTMFPRMMSGYLISNLKIRGYTPKEGTTIKDYTVRESAVVLYGGAIIRNCIVENAKSGILVHGANTSIEGCIIRNTYYSGIYYDCYRRMDKYKEDGNYALDTYVHNVLISNCGVCAVYVDSFAGPENGNENYWHIHLSGKIYMHNWINMDNFSSDFFKDDFDFNLSPFIEEAKKIVKTNFSNYVYNYNNSSYVMIGICGIKLFIPGGCDRIVKYQLDWSQVEEETNVYELKSYSQNVLNTADIDVKFYTLPKNNMFSSPGYTYADDENTFRKIRVKSHEN